LESRYVLQQPEGAILSGLLHIPTGFGGQKQLFLKGITMFSSLTGKPAFQFTAKGHRLLPGLAHFTVDGNPYPNETS
jgi:hypothetical protein